ncbi:MAG: hypothetical protein R3B47_21505 [Bacteroidia bacterium]
MKHLYLFIGLLLCLPFSMKAQFGGGNGDGYASALFVVDPTLPIEETKPGSDPTEEARLNTSINPNPASASLKSFTIRAGFSAERLLGYVTDLKGIRLFSFSQENIEKYGFFTVMLDKTPVPGHYVIHLFPFHRPGDAPVPGIVLKWVVLP